MTENELKYRIKNAIVLLTDGHSFKVGDLTFGAKDNSHFSVTGWTRCNEFQYLTKNRALTELDEIKDLFHKMISVSSELTDFVKSRKIEYCFSYDYGMGGFEICSETDGQIKWITTLEK
ncbi:hypothetical protein [Rhizosphaericola mali]|uniref:DUF1398 domain-containing protein n=1 Tax=Rhizosphaericola mali TaxID=2545455 RepID=A0A5P2G388_9BACT|nr:hypothetical protein [Rhizosphaericola mali]QES88282.1 hypothetical protein E0W69_006235 [Rhizosphaericola mali]